MRLYEDYENRIFLPFFKTYITIYVNDHENTEFEKILICKSKTSE